MSAAHAEFTIPFGKRDELAFAQFCIPDPLGPKKISTTSRNKSPKGNGSFSMIFYLFGILKRGGNIGKLYFHKLSFLNAPLNI